jgi:hypothetical protein
MNQFTGNTTFLRLESRFALGSDDLQWIIYKSRHKDPPPMDGALRPADWKAVSFVSWTKEILLRCMRENGVNLRIEAQACRATIRMGGARQL